MKNYWLALVFFASLFCFASCNNTLDEIGTNEKQVEVELANNGSILRFKSQSAFDATVSTLKQMNENELKEWANSLGFTSLHSIYVDALTEVGTMDDSAGSYQNLKDKYSGSLYFPEYKDDYGIYLPVSNKLYAAFLNADGMVMVGDEVKNFIDIKDYESLQKTGLTLYPEENTSPQLKGSNDYIYVFNGGYIGGIYDSGWKRIDDKMYRVTAGRHLYEVTNLYKGHCYWDVHIQADSRKLINNSWMNYAGISEITGTISPTPGSPYRIGYYDNNPAEISYYGTYPHDFYVLSKYGMGQTINNYDKEGRIVTWAYQANFNMNVVSIGVQNNYNFTLSEVYFVAMY